MLMILITHILVAITSIIFATFTAFQPSTEKIMLSKGAVGATLVSGVVLVATTGAHILSACISGLVYISVVYILVKVAEYRLQVVPTKKD